MQLLGQDVYFHITSPPWIHTALTLRSSPRFTNFSNLSRSVSVGKTSKGSRRPVSTMIASNSLPTVKLPTVSCGEARQVSKPQSKL